MIMVFFCPSQREESKPRKLFNPYILLIFLSCSTFKETFTIFIEERYEELPKFYLSFDHLVSTTKIMAFLIILTNITVISFQLVYYFNNRKGIKPTFLRVFSMISGRIPPESLGLQNVGDILFLIHRTKFGSICFENQ